MKHKILFKPLMKRVEPPKKADEGSSGYDLKSLEDKILLPKESYLFKLGFSLEFSSNLEAQIRSRSGLALKHGLVVLNSPGTIDSSYRGEIGVILFNASSERYEIGSGDKIAQMVFQTIPEVTFQISESLNDSKRGQKGFGSSGR